MTPESTGILVVIAAVGVESFAQLFLKIGASGGAGILAGPWRARAGWMGAGSSARAWISLGLVAYGGEVLLYTLALHYLDVSVAFPMGSLCFVGVALLSRIFLGEAVGRVRWLGVLCIIAGAVCVAL
jgi:undecaprenyl phosphate-alpha-L-ara4N flippase subunit ArnE